VMQGAMSSYLQRFQKPLYIFSVTDAFLDPTIPALTRAGIPPTGQVTLFGSDGTPASYQRVRDGRYQYSIIADPEHEQGWQAVDELNRAFNKKPASDYVPAVHVIYKGNIASDLSSQGYYEPKNDYQSHYKAIWSGHAEGT
jgi:ribose transport system substrate-binding protein